MPAGPPVFHSHPAANDWVIMSTYSSRVFPFFLANTTGTLEADAGLSEAALLRTELTKVWGVAGRLERFAASHMEVSS